MNFFSLGIALMRRLRFAEKFILVSLLFMVPLSLTSFYLFHDMRQQVNSMDRRQMGLQYLAAVNPLLELIPQSRGMTNGLLRGGAGFAAKITVIEPQLADALDKADAANRKWGVALNVTGDWERIRTRWINLKRVAKTLSMDASWDQHTVLIDDYLQLIYRVLITSTLFTTENGALRHLVEINFHYLPKFIEALGQTRGGATGFFTDHKMTANEQRALSLLLSVLQQNMDEVDRQWIFVFETDTELRTEFMSITDKLRKMTHNYVQLARQQGLLTQRPLINTSVFFDTGTLIITDGYTLLHDSSLRLQARFNADSKRLNQRMQWLQILLVFVPICIAYLTIAFFVFIRQTVQQLHYVMDQLQQRKIPSLQQGKGRDELVDIGRLFNRLAGQMIRKNEEDQLLTELTRLGLISESIAVLCDQALMLLLDAHSGMGVKAPSYIQLIRDGDNRYITATTNDDVVEPVIIADSSLQVHQMNVGDRTMWCLPLVYRRSHLGELLLTLEDDAVLAIGNRRLFQRIADALVIAIVRLQAMQSLEERERALTRSNEELERFAYVASHDLQEPLRKICSFGDRLLQNSGLEGRPRDFLSRMVDAAGRMQLLIQDLLLFSRIQSSSRPFAPEDLNRIAMNAIDNLEIAIKECDAVVHVPELSIVDGDAVQLEQLLQNLIGNAIKYRKPDVPPEIYLQMTREEVQDNGSILLHFRCQDNGIGFEQQYADQIFEAFKRLHGRKEYSGSGIGLAVCRRIVERHGGLIRATSIPGEGTCIYFTLKKKHGEK